MTVSQTSVTDAVRHLDARARYACDRLRIKNVYWTLQDVTAVKTLLAEIRPRCPVCGSPTTGGGYCRAHSDLGDAA